MILEAWAPDFVRCCEEAARALLGICIDGSGADVIGEHRLQVSPASCEPMLLDVLEGLVFLLDTTADVPVGADARRLGDGGLEILLPMADRLAVEPIGSAPKAISRSGFEVVEVPTGVRCTFLVDV